MHAVTIAEGQELIHTYTCNRINKFHNKTRNINTLFKLRKELAQIADMRITFSQSIIYSDVR